MESRNYNLAARPEVNRVLSRWRILLTVFLILLFSGAGGWRLGRFLSQQRALRRKASALSLRRDQAREKIDRAGKVIVAQQKIWQDRIDWANGLVSDTAPILSRHLERLESLLPERVKLESLKFERGEENSLTLEVVAATGADLFDLYRRLAGFELKVSGETAQKDGTIRAGLTLTLPGKGV